MTTPATPRVYCTYFDSGYLSRGLALISSLREHGDYSPVYVLALDTPTSTYFDQYAPENVFVLSIEELEKAEPELLPLKTQRSRMEYYFTCTPLLIRYVMNKQNIPGGMSIYLDGDLFFFDDPQLVINAMTDNSVGIIEHRYPDSLAEKLAKYGKFNVGWVGFRDDNAGRAVLDWYSEMTVEWCSDKPENGKYADQGYLNWFPDFPGVRVLTSAGFNLAPWNVKRHTIEATGFSQGTGRVIVDKQPLVFFHFHGLRKVGNRFATGELTYGARLSKTLKNFVYQPYVDKLTEIESSTGPKLLAETSVKKRGTGISGLLSRARKTFLNVVSVATGNSVRPK